MRAMSTIDDLLSQRRRGALSDADERRLQMAVQTSREHQLTLLAGEIFERAGAAQAGDPALIKSIVRQVEGEWSGTFQRVVARRRRSRWVSVPVLMASLAAASFGGYRAMRALRAPIADTAPALVASARPIAAAATPLAEEAPRERGAFVAAAPERAAFAAAAPPTALSEVASTPLPALSVAAAADTVAADTAAADTAGSGTLVSLPEPAPAQRVAPAAAAPVASAAAAAQAAATSWRLPQPKRRKLHAIAPDAELSAVLPVPPPSEAASTGTALAAAPDLESAHALFRRANQLRQTDWDAAASLYERLTLRHSESPEAGVAEMALGKHALADGRAQQALRWFQAYQRREGGALAAEALWGEARAFQSLGEGVRAHELWQRLIDEYPATAYAAAAREQLGP